MSVPTIFRKCIGNARGSIIYVALIITMLVPLVLVPIINTTLNRRVQAINDWDTVLRSEAARGGIAVVEAGLQRRLWEPPADTQCLRSRHFEIKMTTPDSVAVETHTFFDRYTRSYRVESTAKFGSGSTTIVKFLKVNDASDYLIYSGSKKSVLLSRWNDAKQVAGFIGEERRLYLKGELIFNSRVPRDSADWSTSWTDPTPFRVPQDLGIILQGSRMQLYGGMRYHSPEENNLHMPETGEDPALTPMLSPYDPETHPKLWRGQRASGSAFLTSDAKQARQIESVLKTGLGSITTGAADLMKRVFPVALFGGASSKVPIFSSGAVDSGQPFLDEKRWIVARYEDKFGMHETYNFTCLTDSDAVDAAVAAGIDPPYCSSSKVFPKGFKTWLGTANLDDTLFVEETEPLDYHPLNWDNFDALKEDAKTCGHVVASTGAGADGAYEDCDPSDRYFMKNYASSGGSTACPKTYTLNINSLAGKFPKFDKSVYENNKLRGLFLRRIVYSQVKLQITQEGKKGLMPSLASNTARRNMPIWFVNEDQMVIKPFQPDLTPVTDSAGPLPQMYFNQDVDVGGMHPLKLLFLSPEQTQIIGATYVPMPKTDLKLVYPVKSNVVVPVNNIFTDWKRHENDGYAYGSRVINIGDLAVVSSGAVTDDSPFYLRGLWSRSHHASSVILQACAFDNPLTPAPEWFKPAQVEGLGSNFDITNFGYKEIPKQTSKFYFHDPSDGKTKVNSYLIPRVLQSQALSKEGPDSRIYFNGLQLYLNFESKSPPGRRDLSKPIHYNYDYSDDTYVTYNNKKSYYSTTWGWYHFAAGNISSCAPGSIVYNRSGLAKPSWVMVNSGVHVLLQTPPSADFTDIGAVFSIELPMAQVSE
jgi:hypothetical protein